MITLEKFLDFNFPVIYHLTVTGRCNAKCVGCINTLMYGERGSFASTWEDGFEKNIHILRNLLSSSKNQKIFISFYGGEPLLVYDKVLRYYYIIKNKFKDKDLKFVLFTNGMLLDKALSKNAEFFDNLELLIVSIDGKKEQHERFRRGTQLDKIISNLSLLKKTSKVKVLMWSTLREEMSLRNCVEEFLWLKENSLCDYFFWHLIEEKTPISNFHKFFKEYTKDLEFLFALFENKLSQREILPILPLCELFYFLLKGISRGQTGCGVEKLRNFDILGGRVFPCVDLGDEIEITLENNGEGGVKICQEVERTLLRLVSYKEYFGCKFCEAEFYCGGRCPVLIKTSPERARQYCELTKYMVKLAKERHLLIKNLLEEAKMSLEDLYYPYGYLALLTDVVP
ncbi:MAG: radical SAM protein [Caldimicrobium thiodismutans]